MNSSSTIELIYFDLRGWGRGEVPRLMLHYAGKEFLDTRIPTWQDPQHWLALKPTTPWGTLPILKYGDLKLGQSLTIMRFLAKELNLAGKNLNESAQCDELGDVLQDLINSWVPLYFGKVNEVLHQLKEGKPPNFSRDEEGLKRHYETTVPPVLEKIEKILVSRGGEFLVGGSLSWADIFLFSYCEGLLMASPQTLDKVPGISGLIKRVGQLPGIKKYLKNRPVSFP